MNAYILSIQNCGITFFSTYTYGTTVKQKGSTQIYIKPFLDPKVQQWGSLKKVAGETRKEGRKERGRKESGEKPIESSFPSLLLPLTRRSLSARALGQRGKWWRKRERGKRKEKGKSAGVVFPKNKKRDQFAGGDVERRRVCAFVF